LFRVARRGVREVAVITAGRYVLTMRKRLTKIGNSLGIVLDRPLLDSLGVDAETELEVSTDGSIIVVAPVRSKKRDAKLKKITDRVFETYAGAFKKLAE
jgi:antitoxin MazE